MREVVLVMVHGHCTSCLLGRCNNTLIPGKDTGKPAKSTLGQILGVQIQGHDFRFKEGARKTSKIALIRAEDGNFKACQVHAMACLSL